MFLKFDTQESRMRKLDQLVISFPEVYKCIGETDIDKAYEMPKSAVNYRKPRRLSAEQREAARERAGNLHGKRDKVMNEQQSYVNEAC